MYLQTHQCFEEKCTHFYEGELDNKDFILLARKEQVKRFGCQITDFYMPQKSYEGTDPAVKADAQLLFLWPNECFYLTFQNDRKI